MEKDIEFLIRYIEEQSALGKFIKESEFTQTPLNFKDDRRLRNAKTRINTGYFFYKKI